MLEERGASHDHQSLYSPKHTSMENCKNETTSKTVDQYDLITVGTAQKHNKEFPNSASSDSIQKEGEGSYSSDDTVSIDASCSKAGCPGAMDALFRLLPDVTTIPVFQQEKDEHNLNQEETESVAVGSPHHRNQSGISVEPNTCGNMGENIDNVACVLNSMPNTSKRLNDKCNTGNNGETKPTDTANTPNTGEAMNVSEPCPASSFEIHQINVEHDFASERIGFGELTLPTDHISNQIDGFVQTSSLPQEVVNIIEQGTVEGEKGILKDCFPQRSNLQLDNLKAVELKHDAMKVSFGITEQDITTEVSTTAFGGIIQKCSTEKLSVKENENDMCCKTSLKMFDDGDQDIYCNEKQENSPSGEREVKCPVHGLEEKPYIVKGVHQDTNTCSDVQAIDKHPDCAISGNVDDSKLKDVPATLESSTKLKPLDSCVLRMEVLCPNIKQESKHKDICVRDDQCPYHKQFKLKQCFVQLHRLEADLTETDLLSTKVEGERFTRSLLHCVSSAKATLHRPDNNGIPEGKHGNLKKRMHVCPICGEDCSYPSWLKKHMRTKHKGVTHMCETCGKWFKSQRNLSEHQEIHQGVKLYECSFCGKHISRHSIKYHEMMHTGRGRFTCKECGKPFISKPAFQRHKRSHSGEKPLKCPYCEKSFGTPQNVKVHIRYVHNREKNYQCSQCGVHRSSLQALKQHILIHTGEKPHKCEQCDKSFTVLSYLRTHQHMHSGEKPFKCPLCCKTFRQNAHLKTHIRTHTGETPFKCSVCGKGFGQSSHLRTHMTTHTGEKRYKCSFCGMCFAHKGTWRVHERLHTGEEPHKCQQCGRCFKNPSSLGFHLKLHKEDKNYKCPQCDMTFFVHSSLRDHQMRAHSDDRPHVCKKCAKGFVLKSELMSHMKKHGVSHPYCCDQCGKRFKKAYPLKVHVRTSECKQ